MLIEILVLRRSVRVNRRASASGLLLLAVAVAASTFVQILYAQLATGARLVDPAGARVRRARRADDLASNTDDVPDAVVLVAAPAVDVLYASDPISTALKSWDGVARGCDA
jgi:hypothetical protein